MTRIEIHQVDVFTRSPLTGNAAAVVPDARGLTEEQMQGVAREMNLSETAFVLPPSDLDHDVRVRFFTPTTEVPSCGHATLATHYILARTGRTEPGVVRQKIGAGILPVRVDRDGDDLRMTMTQRTPMFDPPLDSEGSLELAGALGVPRQCFERELPIQRVDTGNSKYLVAVRSREVLDGLDPDPARLRRFHGRRPSGGFYVFTLDRPDADVDAHARMFAPQIGIIEDPVTGNGAGPLGAYAVVHNRIRHGPAGASMAVRQGEAMGRPGTAYVDVDVRDGRPVGVRVSGYAVVVWSGELRL